MKVRKLRQYSSIITCVSTLKTIPNTRFRKFNIVLRSFCVFTFAVTESAYNDKTSAASEDLTYFYFFCYKKRVYRITRDTSGYFLLF